MLRLANSATAMPQFACLAGRQARDSIGRSIKLGRQRWRGAAAGMQVGLPEQAGRDGAPGTPLLADLAQRRLAGPAVESYAFHDPELQAEIAGRPDVGAAE